MIEEGKKTLLLIGSHTYVIVKVCFCVCSSLCSYMSWVYICLMDGVASLKDNFIFLTGCDHIPPLGFPEADKTIQFDSDELVPKVSTCSLVLRQLTAQTLTYADELF